jgi:uncharacterized protein (TIGR00299 family) protein
MVYRPGKMRIAYFDCFAGVSGDMILSALLDAGVPSDALRDELAKLPLDGCVLEARKLVRNNLAGTYMWLRTPAANASTNGHAEGQAPILLHTRENGHAQSEGLGLIESITSSTLSSDVKRKALAAVRLLVEAETEVRGGYQGHLEGHETMPLIAPTDVDTLVEIVGVAIGLTMLEVSRVECSPVNIGGGYVTTPQGVRPVPAPAIAEILRSATVPVYGTDANRELVTPNGAAIIAAMCDSFGPMPALKMHKLGYGMGKPDASGDPAMLRVTVGDFVPDATVSVGRPQDRAHRPDEEWVALVEANLDDMNPRYYDFVMDRLLGHGALDVYLVPVQMRQNRPGVVLSVVCKPEQVDTLAAIVFEETTTLGIRISEMPRRILQWDTVQAHTAWGHVNVRVARGMGGNMLHVKPEYEDVKRLAIEMNLPVDYVYEEARRAGSPYLHDGHQQMGRLRDMVPVENK